MRALAALHVPALLCAAAPVLADAPTAGDFVGRYRAIGLDGMRAGVLLDADLRLDLDGAGLRTTTCDDEEGRLDFNLLPDSENYLTGNIVHWIVWCRFNADGEDHEILNCASEDGLRLTLWPDAEGFDGPLRCGEGEDGGTLAPPPAGDD